MENIRKIYKYDSENYDNEDNKKLDELDKKFDRLFNMICKNNIDINRKFNVLDKKMDSMDKKLNRFI